MPNPFKVIRVLDDAAAAATRVADDIPVNQRVLTPPAHMLEDIPEGQRVLPVPEGMLDEAPAPQPQQNLTKLEDGVHIDDDTGELFEVTQGKIKALKLDPESQRLVDVGLITPEEGAARAANVPAAPKKPKNPVWYSDTSMDIDAIRSEALSSNRELPGWLDAKDDMDLLVEKWQRELPDDLEFDELLDNLEVFSPQEQRFLKALDRDDWLGADYPAQAVEELRSGDPRAWDLSPGTKSAMGRLRNKNVGN